MIEIKLESKINFTKGTYVRYNPYNHKFQSPKIFLKNKDRIGTVYSEDTEGKIIYVNWNDTCQLQKINYQRLLTITKAELIELKHKNEA